MKIRALTLTLALTCGAGLLASEAEAKKPYENLKVLADNGKTLEKGMKSLTKGLGVKCKACHVKGKFESDDMETKVKARDFFTKTVGTKDPAARKAALDQRKNADEDHDVDDGCDGNGHGLQSIRVGSKICAGRS